jgi:hypothetical protein
MSTIINLYMRNHLTSILSIACGVLTTSYVGLMVATIFFAAWQTQAVNSVRTTQSAIGNLEANYYQAVNHLSGLNPASQGYVSPTQVEYVAESVETSTGLSFAGN